MITLLLDGEVVTAVRRYRGRDVRSLPGVHRGAARELARWADDGSDDTIAWIDRSVEAQVIPPVEWKALRRHRLELLHLGDLDPLLPPLDTLGWIDAESPALLLPPADRRFATWLVSPRAGLVDRSVLRALSPEPRLGFAAMLLDLARRGTTLGLFPLSEPRLKRPGAAVGHPPALRPSAVASLVRRAFGWRWLAVWVIASVLFRRHLPLAAALLACRAGASPALPPGALDRQRPTAAAGPPAGAVEAVIPTLDRPAALRDLLHDLAAQTTPLSRVLIVDQRPADGTEDERSLDPAAPAEGPSRWPFAVERFEVRWTGACRARNHALRHARGGWLLLLDDDLRLPPAFVETLHREATLYGAEAATAAVHLAHQSPGAADPPRLWPHFASGAALVSQRAMAAAGGFDERLDGGYGEDYELGARLQRAGYPVIVVPAAQALHLKSPSGGLRRPFAHPWHGDPGPSPRPSPTVLLSRRLHQTPTMRQGYRLLVGVNDLRRHPPWAWLRAVLQGRRAWRSSERWADLLESRPWAVGTDPRKKAVAGTAATASER